MLFCSGSFALFFAVVFAVYWLLPWPRGRVWWLLAASVFFYASWNVRLAAIIGLSSAFNYALGLVLDASRTDRRRRTLLAVSLAGNLGLLAYFKYANFFLGSLGVLLRGLGSNASVPILSVILPIGLSFHAFEAISYSVDVYRRRLTAERDPANFFLFLLFFPHLVAGPIVRAADFLPQVVRAKRWDWLRVQWGVQLFLRGVLKKVAIADRMAPFVDPVFARPEAFNTHSAWVAMLAYGLQIYGDFSGYSDMALGCAHLLGYKLPANFEQPYLAPNISEFWRRWHISLSSWLRDYFFIPLGGSRGSSWRTARNLLATMTLGGLWHGASWTFVAWGGLHGLLLIGHRAFRAHCRSRPWLERVLVSVPGTVARVALTFLCVCLGWVFFRAPTFATALAIFERLVVLHGGDWPPQPEGGFWVTLAVLGSGHVLASRRSGGHRSTPLPAPVLGFGYAAALTLALLLAPSAGKPFVYFQF